MSTGAAGEQTAGTDLRGEVAVVTGGSRGIGRAIAVRLGRLGADVVVGYVRGAEAANETVAEIERAGSAAIAVQVDVSLPGEIRALFDTAADRFGGIDIAIANAGLDETGGPLLEVTEEAYDRMMGVNAKGAFFTLQQAALTIRDGGSIVSIGSSTTIRPVAGFGLYAASKLPAGHIVGVLAQETGARRITVNAVLPTATEGAGYFSTAVEGDQVRVMARRGSPIGGRMGEVRDVADAVEFFVGPLSRWISGQQLLVAGGALS